MGIFSEEAGRLGILQGNIGPGSNFFDFIKNEASNALGLNQAIGQTPPPNKSFVREGFGTDPSSGVKLAQPRTFRGQEPDCRIFIKKKAFGGFRGNFSSALLNPRERLYSRIFKRLYANKLETLGQAELLTKFVKKISNNRSYVGKLAMNALSDIFRNGSDKAIFDGLTFLSKEEDRIANTTISKWIIDPSDTDSVNLGKGTGVIEITNVSSLTSNLSLEEPGDMGSVSLSIEDPFNIMLITPVDIQQAVDLERAASATYLQSSLKAAASKVDSINQNIQNLNNVTAQLNNGRDPGNQLDNINFSLNNTTTNSLTDPGKISIMRGNTPLSPTQSVDQTTLLPEEERLYRQVVSQIGEYKDMSIGIHEQATTASNDDFVSIQQDLLKTFAGRTIVNAMDHIYVYISNNGTNEQSIPVQSDDQQSESFFRAEWTKRHASGDLPSSITQDLYVQLQKQKLIKSSRRGSFVFVGLVDTVNRSYGDGKHTVRINGSNNAKWLGFSKINTQPDALQPQGALNNPLTPFDEVTTSDGKVTLKLSDANRRKLTPSEQQDIDQKIAADPSLIRNIGNFENLTFKWKRGLYSTSLRVAFSRSLSNDPQKVTANDAQFKFGLLVNQNAFSNLDAANIISILVCGVPYNFATFLKDAVKSGIYTQGPNSHRTYAASVLALSSAFNDANGQFEPLIQINVIPADYHSPVKESFFRSDVDSQISTLSAQIQEKNDLLLKADDYLGRYSDVIDDSNIVDSKGILAGAAVSLDEQVIDLELQKDNLVALKQLRLTERNAAYQEALGALQLPSQSRSNIGTDDDINIRLRHLQALLYQKQFKDIGSVLDNQDKNYLVIGNEYEEDFDIQAFVQFLRGEGPDLWQSHYESPLEICKHVASSLDFEFFNDTQGNIHFRPPQYNKTPLSVFQKLLRADKNRKIFPASITSLLNDRVTGLNNEADTIQSNLTARLKERGPNNSEKISEEEINRTKTLISDLKNTADDIQKQLNSIQGLTIGGLLQPSNPLFDKFVEVDTLLPINPGSNKEDRQSADAINQRFDDLGLDSHKRFIISDSSIMQFSFDEAAPPYTRVDVTGQTNLVNIADAAAPALWAGAVDYDLWRQFGYITQEFTKPYFRSPEFQCRPYAEFLMSRARKQIIRGTVEVVGNEYYQLGDVVMFEPYGLLFYVTRIQHSFTFGSQYTTELTLTYGRAPGEFIPTPLDIIGKNAIKIGSLVNAISSELSPTNKVVTSSKDVTVSETVERVLGVLQVFTDPSDNTVKLEPSSNNYQEALRVLSLAHGLIGQVSFSSITNQPIITKLHLRYFDNTGASADVAKAWLKEPVNLLNNSQKLNLYSIDQNLVGDASSDAIVSEAFDENKHKFSPELCSFFSDGVPKDHPQQLSTLVEVRAIAEAIDADKINRINAALQQKIGISPSNQVTQ